MKDERLISIRSAAMKGPLSEHALRQRLKENRLPGIHVNTRFYVNYPQFLAQIEMESQIDGSSMKKMQ